MSIHNICFHGEIRKILCGYSLLSVAMITASSLYVDQSSVLLAASLFGRYLSKTKQKL